MEELLNLALEALANRKTADNGDDKKREVKPTIEEKPKKEEVKDSEDKLNKEDNDPIDYNPPQPWEDHLGQPPWEDQPWRWRPPSPYGGRGDYGYRRPYYNNYYGGGRAYSGFNRD